MGPTPATDPDFRTLFESAPGLYLVLNPTGLRIVAVSDAFLRATNTIREQILGRSILDVFPGHTADLQTSLDNVRVNRVAAATELRQRSGIDERLWRHVSSPVLEPGGQLAYIIHSVEDVTEFVRHQQAGHELAGVHQEIVRLLALTDAEINRTGGEQPRDFVVEPIGPTEMLARLYELVAAHKGLEEQLRQAQKLEVVGRLADGIAHDFNNSLTLITGHASLLRGRLSTAQAAHHLEEIDRAASRAASLTGQLQAFSRKQVMRPRRIDLNAIVSGMEGLLKRLVGEDISLVTVLASRLGHVKADPSQIELVIMNLVVHARESMPSGGRLVIETRNVEMEPGPAHVLLSVSDTGHGMDAGTAERIFEPFSTTKDRGVGSGISLSTVYEVVEQSGGTLSFLGEPGGGSIFRIYLPVAADDAAEAGSQTLPAAETIKGTILLVEDEVPLRILIRTVLAEAGHNVVEAANGAEALQLCDKFSEPIDLLLTDVVMPRMSGPELMEKLQISRSRLPVLFMSGYDRDLINRMALDADANFLPKPFTPEALLAKIGELLASRTGKGVRSASS